MSGPTRLRIGVIAPPWLAVPPCAYGGTETVIDALARGLARAGHDVRLVAHPDSTCPVARTSVVPASDCVPMGRSTIDLEHAVGAYAALRDVDVVHDHTLSGLVHSAAWPDDVVVHTNHNLFDRPRTRILSAVVPRVAVVAISRHHAATTRLPIAAVVHHGIDVDAFPAGEGAGGYAAVLSRMSPGKGIHRAIDVAQRAGVPLRIAAKMHTADERDYFTAMVQPRLGAGVEYVGELADADKRPFLADAIALLNPITWPEPFGMTMLEAMACGTPVVGGAAGAAPELVADGVSGFLRDDEDGWVAALASVGSLHRAACRNHVATLFSVERMVEGYLAVYRRALRRAGRVVDHEERAEATVG